MIITVTGRIGTGKTTVAKMLAQKLGYSLIDADRIGHLLLEKPIVKARVVQQFGKVILVNGVISRKKLGKIVFSQPAKLRALNRILHPLITNEIIRKSSARRCIVDAALYNELKLDRLSDLTILVKAPEALIMKRLKGEYSKTQITSILKAQKIKAKPDFIINNDGTLIQLKGKISKIIAKIK